MQAIKNIKFRVIDKLKDLILFKLQGFQKQFKAVNSILLILITHFQFRLFKQVVIKVMLKLWLSLREIMQLKEALHQDSKIKIVEQQILDTSLAKHRLVSKGLKEFKLFEIVAQMQPISSTKAYSFKFIRQQLVQVYINSFRLVLILFNRQVTNSIDMLVISYQIKRNRQLIL